MGAKHGLVRGSTEGRRVALGPNRVRFLITADDTGGVYSLTEWEMAPPPAPSPPLHVHEDADETVYVLEGAMRFQVGDEVRQASPGAVVLVPKGTRHTVANAGPWPARFLVVMAPAGFERYWEEAAQLAAASGGSPDPEAMLALQRKHHMATDGQARTFAAGKPEQ